MTETEIQKAIAGHESRNAALRKLLLEKKVDLREPRTIECHFWAWDEQDAAGLVSALEERGFTTLVRRPAVTQDVPTRWNIEVEIIQPVETIMTRDITEQLVRLAESLRAQYDGWGTRI